MKKRVLSILAVLAVAVNMVGCAPSDSSAPVEATGQVVEETSAEAFEMKTIEPPEDGWTLENLNEVLYMNGKPIDLPLMFSSLGDGYEIRDKRYNDETGSDGDIVGGYLYYNDELVALVTFYQLESDIEFLTLFFYPYVYENHQNSSNYIKINGFGLKNEVDEVYNLLGNKFVNESEIITYTTNDGNCSITIPNIEKDFSILLEISHKELDKNNWKRKSIIRIILWIINHIQKN